MCVTAPCGIPTNRSSASCDVIRKEALPRVNRSVCVQGRPPQRMVRWMVRVVVGGGGVVDMWDVESVQTEDLLSHNIIYSTR